MVKSNIIFFIFLSTSIFPQEQSENYPYAVERIPASEPITSPQLNQKVNEFEGENLPTTVSLKKPWIATSLASIFPGLGHVYLGDYKTGGYFAGGTLLGLSLYKVDGYATAVTINNFSCYTVYAAYRDARSQPGLTGYNYKMPKDSLLDLCYAPFNPKIMKKPEVFGGVICALAAASIITQIGFPKEVNATTNRLPFDPLPILALPIGIGEEALFRGFLQPTLTESLGVKGGITTSSIIFGAAHIGNAQAFNREDQWRYYCYSIPLITGLGAYMGWLSHKNGSLQESVAVHSWYDFAIFSSSAIASCCSASIAGNFYSITIPF